MKQTFSIFLTTLSALFTAVDIASADSTSILGASDDSYISIFGGAAFLDDVTHSYEHALSPATNGLTTHGVEPGYILGLSWGRKLHANLRGEIELSHSNSSIQSQGFSNPLFASFSGSASGRIKTTNLLANLWYDFPHKGSFQPYAGGGVGIGLVDSSSLLSGQTDAEITGSDLALAYQVGVGFKISASDNIEFDLGYRLKGLRGAQLGTAISTQSNGSFDTYGHYIQFGVSIGLNRK